MNERHRRNRKYELEDQIFFALKVGFLAFLVYAFTSMSFAPVATTCVRCHSDKQASHELAAHSAVSCHSCHSGTTVTERLSFRITFSRMLPAALLQRHPETTLVTNRDCGRCHEYEVQAPINSTTGIRVSHTEMIAGGYQCTDCHSEIAHSLTGGSVRRVEMFGCFDCHRTLESARCETCHAEKATRERRPYTTAWRLAHGEDWQKLHGMGGLKNCAACHAPDYCVKCHGTELPHPSGFYYQHGAAAQDERAGASCLDCHDEERFCISCHQVDMPHPDDFLQTHSRASDEDEEKCLKCHESAVCVYCHTRHTHPGIPSDDLQELRRRLIQ